MAEKHKIYSAGGGQWRDYMYAMWDFIHNQQSGILQFVDDGGTKSVYLGAAFWNGVDVLTASSFASGSYIVVEPTEAYPGGGEWQVKFLCGNPTGTGAGTGDMSVKMSFSGGWNATTNTDFASVATAVTDAEQLLKNVIAAADTIYISCSNSDTYDSDKKYSYFRFLNWNQNSSEDEKFEGVYAGGYIPADVTSDTRPSVLMCRLVTVLNTSDSWGQKTSRRGFVCGAGRLCSHFCWRNKCGVCRNWRLYRRSLLLQFERWQMGECTLFVDR